MYEKMWSWALVYLANRLAQNWVNLVLGWVTGKPKSSIRNQSVIPHLTFYLCHFAAIANCVINCFITLLI